MLEVSDITKTYGARTVVDRVSFSVPKGEILGFLGLNGAGKTTTVTTIAGLLKPTRGEILFDGEPIGGRPPASLVERGISLSPEGRRVFPRLTVDQNLRLGAWVRRRESSVIDEQRDLVFDYFPRLSERATQLAGTLSGGEQQMLAIGRAIMSRPRLLLVDEASLGLSPTVAKVVFEVMSRINDDGTTVLIVEQNAGVLPYADRALIMEKGTLVYTGVGDEIRDADLRATYLGA